MVRLLLVLLPSHANDSDDVAQLSEDCSLVIGQLLGYGSTLFDGLRIENLLRQDLVG